MNTIHSAHFYGAVLTSKHKCSSFTSFKSKTKLINLLLAEGEPEGVVSLAIWILVWIVPCIIFDL